MPKREKILTLLFLSFIFFAKDNVFALEDSLLTPSFNSKVQEKQIKNQYFNLANIVEGLLNNEQKVIEDNIGDRKSQTRKEFLQITSKFNQGNASVAYDEYEKLIDKIEEDSQLLAISKVFYEIGYFSLASKALNKIVYKNQYFDNITSLEKSYLPKSALSKEEEIYFAKLYSSVYFDNCADETINELLSEKNKYQKNDFYNFMLARAYFESKKYQDALNAVNKAISIAPECLQYQFYKIDILTAQKKYQDALKLVEKFEKNPQNINFAQNIEIKKENITSLNTKNDKLKKYHTVKKEFLEGNFEKAKKDCQNILNFDKDNPQIITLYAKSELALSNVERANSYFVNSYKLDKNNTDTIIGIGDIKFLHKDYKNAVKMYKKAYKKDKNNYEIIIKLASAQREYAKNPKELKKLEQKLDSMPKNKYFNYYLSAISIAQKNDVLKEEFLKSSLMINPMHENSLGALVELYLKNNNLQLAKGLITNASLTLEKNYYYYYLCGLYNQAINKKQEAVRFYKTSIIN